MSRKNSWSLPKFGVYPEEPGNITPYISEEIIGSFTHKGTMYLESIEGPGIFTPFSGMEHKFLTRKRLRGDKITVPRNSLLYHGDDYLPGEGSVDALEIPGIENIAYKVPEEHTATWSTRERVAYGIYQLLRDHDPEESQRLFVAVEASAAAAQAGVPAMLERIRENMHREAGE